MSATNHTPLPWVAACDGYTCPQIRSKGIPVKVSGDLADYYQTLATVTQRDAHPTIGGGISAAESKANAVLIISAVNFIHRGGMSAVAHLFEAADLGEVDWEDDDTQQLEILRAALAAYKEEGGR